MFGLTFDKLLIIGVIAVFILGPDRLPYYASQLAKLVRQVRTMANNAKSRVREEMGDDFDEVDWKKLDPRQYDPRRIIRDALLEDDEPVATVKPPAKIAPPVTAPLPETSYVRMKRLAEDGRLSTVGVSPYDSEAT